MKSFLLRCLGVGFLIMSETSVAMTGKTLLLETSQGQVEIKLLPNVAPNHVARIIELAESGFYDGIIFHRVIPGFMAQTGDPTGTGMGGSGNTLDAEFSDYEYREGTVGMARSMSPNSADSQFFICFDGCGHLTGQYTVWGQVESVWKLLKNWPSANHLLNRIRLFRQSWLIDLKARLAPEKKMGKMSTGPNNT